MTNPESPAPTNAALERDPIRIEGIFREGLLPDHDRFHLARLLMGSQDSHVLTVEASPEDVDANARVSEILSAARAFATQRGLEIRIEKDESEDESGSVAWTIVLGDDERTLEKTGRYADNPEKAIKYMKRLGYPESIARAERFKEERVASEDLRDEIRESVAYQFFCDFHFSKDNWREEFAWLEEQVQQLEQAAPVLYLSITDKKPQRAENEKTEVLVEEPDQAA